MENELLKLKNISELEAIEEPKEGQVAFLEETNEYMVYANAQWMPVEAQINNEGNLQLNLYELNKQIISQLPPFEEEQWNKAEETFNKWIENTSGKYHMLYGREINYFTVFTSEEENKETEFKNMFEAVKACLDFVGIVHVFDITEDGNAIEIWVKHADMITCMYLFKYDTGIVTYAK